MWPNPQETADLATFTEEILNIRLCTLYSVTPRKRYGTLTWNGLKENNFFYGKYYFQINSVFIERELALRERDVGDEINVLFRQQRMFFE